MIPSVYLTEGITPPSELSAVVQPLRTRGMGVFTTATARRGTAPRITPARARAPTLALDLTFSAALLARALPSAALQHPLADDQLRQGDALGVHSLLARQGE